MKLCVADLWLRHVHPYGALLLVAHTDYGDTDRVHTWCSLADLGRWDKLLGPGTLAGAWEPGWDLGG